MFLLVAVLAGAPSARGQGLATRPATATAPATAPGGESRWFQVLLEDRPAGWMHTQTRATPTGTLETLTAMEVALDRGALRVRIGVDSAFEETAEGKPLRAKQVQKYGAMATTQEVEFKEGQIELVSRQGDRETRRPLAAPTGPAAGWLPPAAAQRYTEAKLAEGAREVRLWTFDLGAGTKPFEVVLTYRGEENVEVLGKVVPATAWDQSASVLPGMVMKLYLDAKGEPVKSTLPMLPGMNMTLVLADEALAKAEVDPPAMLDLMLVAPDRPLQEPRRLRKAVYELALDRGGQARAAVPASKPADGQATDWLPPTTAAQTAARGAEAGRIRVVEDLDAPPAEADRAAPDDSCRRSTTLLNFEDPKLRELLGRALPAGTSSTRPAKGEDSPADAERLRRFVHHYIHEKNLSVGFATASEVARTAEGDCTEHAVLLAALLRGAGIPSRTATGLIYVDEFLGREGVFGYHMWSQAWLDPDGAGPAPGRWVDLDATLPDAAPFDAAHITLATTALADEDTANDMVRLMPVIGRVSIRVMEPAKGAP